MIKKTLTLITLLITFQIAFAQNTPDLKEQMQKGEEQFAQMVANQTYLFGLPLVLEYQFINRMKGIAQLSSQPNSKIKMGNIEDGLQLNEWLHVFSLPTHDFKSGAAPNDDTHYSVMFADLSKEPLILSLPPITDRYYSITITDAYNENLYYISTRLGDTKGGNYALVGPNFTGKLPKNITKSYKMPHNFFGFLARVEVNGSKEDQAKAEAIQRQFKSESLSKFIGKIKEDEKVNVPNVPRVTNGLEWFSLFLKGLQANPPIARDVHFLKQMEQIGLKADGTTDVNSLSPVVKKALQNAFVDGQNMVQWYNFKGSIQLSNKWTINYTRGVPEHDYLYRAQYSQAGLYGHTKEEALYPRTGFDSNGELLDGKNKYVLTIPKDKLPPVNCFWSMVTYDMNSDFVKNEQYHYSVGSNKTNQLKPNADGSITIYAQSEMPESGLGNWLATPKEGNFIVVVRLYCPKPELFDPKVLETYLPKIEKVK